MILLQTLVMAVIFAMISVMVMQWVLGRYMIAARSYRSNAAKTRAQGYSLNLFSTWKDDLGSIPASGDIIVDTQTITYAVTNGSGNGMRTIEITVEEDQ
jgi:hypothetical protein